MVAYSIIRSLYMNLNWQNFKNRYKVNTEATTFYFTELWYYQLLSSKDNPQITLLQNRMYSDSYSVKQQNYTGKKKNFENRVKRPFSLY